MVGRQAEEDPDPARWTWLDVVTDQGKRHPPLDLDRPLEFQVGKIAALIQADGVSHDWAAGEFLQRIREWLVEVRERVRPCIREAGG